MWIIVGEKFKSDNRWVARVKCSHCGAERVARTHGVRIDTKCRICNVIERNRSSLGKHRGIGGLTRTYFNYFRTVAKRRGVAFTVTIEELWTLAVKQDMYCALTGLRLIFPSFTANGNMVKDGNCPSLDRIDSRKPYQTGNVQWVHQSVNVMKNGFSQEEFVHFCHLVAARHANQQPSVLYGNRKNGTKVQRLGAEADTPVMPPRAPSPSNDGDEIVRSSGESRRGEA
jgi:hypothetical protein